MGKCMLIMLFEWESLFKFMTAIFSLNIGSDALALSSIKG